MRLLTLLFLISTYSFSQTKEQDSLRSLLDSSQSLGDKAYVEYKLGYSYYRVNTDSAIYYANKSYESALKSDNDSVAILSRIELASIYMHRDVNAEKALQAVEQGFTINATYNNPNYEYALNNRKGDIAMDQGDFITAIAYHLKNVDVAKNMLNNSKLSYAYSGVAESYRLQKNGVSSVEYAEKAYEISKQLGEEYNRTKFGMALNLSLSYDLNGELEKSIQLLESIVPLAQKVQPFSVALVKHNLGRGYIRAQRYDDAEKILLEVLTIEPWSGTPRRKLATLKELTTLYNERNQPSNALETGEEAYKLAKELDIQYHLEDMTRNLSKTYELAGDFKRSLELQKEYTEIRREIFDKETNELIVSMDAKFQSSQKEKEITELKAKKDIADRNKIILLISGVAALLIAVLGTLYYRKKHRFASTEMLLEKNKKELLASQLDKEKAETIQQRQEKEIISLELKLKQKELTTNAISLLQKKEQYESLISKLKVLKTNSPENAEALNAIISEAKASLVNYNWEEFQHVFEKVHVDFYNNLLGKYPNITPNEKRLSALLKLGMSTKDISAITNQTSHSILIARSRLRKKLGLKKEDSLTHFIDTI